MFVVKGFVVRRRTADKAAVPHAYITNKPLRTEVNDTSSVIGDRSIHRLRPHFGHSNKRHQFLLSTDRPGWQICSSAAHRARTFFECSLAFSCQAGSHNGDGRDLLPRDAGYRRRLGADRPVTWVTVFAFRRISWRRLRQPPFQLGEAGVAVGAEGLGDPPVLYFAEPAAEFRAGGDAPVYEVAAR